MAELIRTNKEPVHSSAILTPELQVTDGLVSYWPMLKNQGTTLFDRKGNNNGTINGATWNNGALDFDGTDDYVEVPDDSSLDITKDLTVEAWVYDIGGIHTAGFVGKENSWDISSRLGEDIYAFFYNGSSWEELDTNTEIYSLEEWFHVVMRYDYSNSKLAIFVDGDKVNNRTVSGSIDTTNNPVEIGRRGYEGNLDYFDGKIDEVRIYDKALSSTEIQTIYNRGRKTHNQRTLIPINTDGLVGYWPMTQGSDGTAYDESKNGNDGTIHGAGWANTANGKTLDFDGTDDDVEVPYSSEQDTKKWTVTAWVKANSFPGYASIVTQGNSASVMDPCFNLALNDDQVHAQFGDNTTGSTYNSSGTITLDTWYHLAITVDGSDVIFYINGSGEAPQTQQYDAVATVELTIIGDYKSSHNYPFDGKIDEVRIYDKALSAQEITNIYEKTRNLYGV